MHRRNNVLDLISTYCPIVLWQRLWAEAESFRTKHDFLTQCVVENFKPEVCSLLLWLWLFFLAAYGCPDMVWSETMWVRWFWFKFSTTRLFAYIFLKYFQPSFITCRIIHTYDQREYFLWLWYISVRLNGTKVYSSPSIFFVTTVPLS